MIYLTLLCLFTARHCFSLEDFVVHVALPSLLTVSNEGKYVFNFFKVILLYLSTIKLLKHFILYAYLL